MNFIKEDLKKLTSNINYAKFENTQDECNDVYYYSDIEDGFDLYPKIKDFSQKLQEAFCFMYNRKMYHNMNIDDDLCSYFYYWLGHNILQRIWIRSSFSRIIKMLYDELNKTDMFTICKPPYENIDEHSFIKYKLLFDYSRDHENINLNTVNPNTTCDKHYKEAIDEYINTYNDVYLSCEVNKEEKYDCDYFHKLFKKDRYEKLPLFYCRKYDAQTFSREAQSGIETRQHPLDQSPNSKGNTVFVREPYTEENSNQQRGHIPHENHNFTAQHRLDTNALILTDHNTEGGSSKTIASSVVPVLGVSSFSLLLYKVIRNIIDIHEIIVYT
ncbi:hypothetical protein PVMG_05518 [Plasmodium vivax Mauritania I]|uniref:Uncharacterized protein n=1 Tax=Plasmodium vivax Mauritania I TaxID=1035515 RepID=A0A0J9TJH9_PLAVI|nr:hypothetical protein PVMG_05518 [Plasmodium vivax Mauritania I]